MSYQASRATRQVPLGALPCLAAGRPRTRASPANAALCLPRTAPCAQARSQPRRAAVPRQQAPAHTGGPKPEPPALMSWISVLTLLTRPAADTSSESGMMAWQSHTSGRDMREPNRRSANQQGSV